MLEALDAVLMLGDGRVVDEVGRQELVEEVQIVLVLDLLYQPADDCLVLFCRDEGFLSIDPSQGRHHTPVVERGASHGWSILRYLAECVEEAFSEVRTQPLRVAS